jgi:hypothetical protein
MRPIKLFLAVVVSIVAIGAGAVASLADSTPIGPLPAGPVSSIDTQRCELVALAVPNRGAGRVWRIARPLDAKVVRQVAEADVGSSTVLVFRAVGRGDAVVSLALTKGDTSARALEARRFRIHVR